MNYVTYMLECADGSLYTGITTDIERRLREHNGEDAGGAKYTSSRRPVRVVYTQEFLDRSSASKEEYRIKQLTREEKKILLKKS